MFESYTRGQSAVFARNAAYNWAPGNAAHNGPAHLDRVTFRFLPEYAVRTGALTSGQVDLIEGVQPTDAPLFAEQPGFKLLTGPSGASTSFTFNINYTRPPADDVRVRRALRDGFDLEPIVKQVYLGTVPRAWSIIGPANPAYNKALVGSWGNDIAGANKLLDEAGWTGRDSEGFRTKDGKRLSIEVGYPQPYVRDNRDILIQGVQAALRKNVGLDLNLRLITAGEYAKNNANGTWMIYPNTDNPSDPARELWDMLGSKGFLYSNIPNPDAGDHRARSTSRCGRPIRSASGSSPTRFRSAASTRPSSCRCSRRAGSWRRRATSTVWASRPASTRRPAPTISGSRRSSAMWSRIVSRLFTSLVVAWASVTATFLALHALPGRIQDILAGDVEYPGLREAIAAEWGLDRSSARAIRRVPVAHPPRRFRHVLCAAPAGDRGRRIAASADRRACAARPACLRS